MDFHFFIRRGSVGIRGFSFFLLDKREGSVGIPGDPWGSLGIRGDPWGSVGIPGDPWGSLRCTYWNLCVTPPINNYIVLWSEFEIRQETKNRFVQLLCIMYSVVVNSTSSPQYIIIFTIPLPSPQRVAVERSKQPASNWACYK